MNERTWPTFCDIQNNKGFHGGVEFHRVEATEVILHFVMFLTILCNINVMKNGGSVYL